MHNKKNNINKSQSFIQGLRPFSSSIPKTLKKYLRKGGYNYSNIVDNWTKIMDKKISDACYPTTIKMGKEMRDGILVLNVIHGKELDVEYEKKNMIDKINSFFGYEFVEKIILKVIEEKRDYSLYHRKVQNNKINVNKLSKKKINNIENNVLKQSLKDFIKAYENKN